MLAWKSLLSRLAWSVGITMPSKMIISKYPEFCRCSWPLMTSAGMPGQLWLLWAGSISTPFPFFHSTRSFFLSLSLSDPSHRTVKFSACHWQHRQDLWSLEKSPFCLDPVLYTNPNQQVLSVRSHCTTSASLREAFILKPPLSTTVEFRQLSQNMKQEKPEMRYKKQTTTTKFQIPTTECDFKQVAKCCTLFPRFLFEVCKGISTTV